jgi:hypothetical protein
VTVTDIIAQGQDPLDPATFAPAAAADPVLALHRMHVRLGYDRQAHLAWYDRERPGALAWPADPATEEETRAVIAAYSATPAAAEPVADVLEVDAADRSDMLTVMTEGEAKWLLAYIAGCAPRVFDNAIANRPSPYRPEGFAAELLERIDARDQAEYMAEPEGYCTACGGNVSHFIGYEGPQHFRGPHKLVTGAERRELFDAGHAPAVAWRESAAVGGGQ